MEAVKEKPKLQKYPAYIDSNIDWIGKVPNHWTVKKLKHLFIEKKKTTNPKLNCGSISFGKVVYKDDEKVTEATKSSYQEVLKGDFLINPLNLNYDLISLRIALSRINVVVSSGYIVLQNRIDLDKSYFNYLLHIFDVSFMKTLRSGVRQTLSFNHLANSELLYPPLQEQTAIANFLEEKCGKVDTAIAQKQQLIELLKERKQIIIQNAVTKGLDPDVKMKDSGVEWIGEIPEHWEVSKLSYLSYKIGDGLHGTPIYTDHTEFFFINGNNLGNKKISITEATKTVSDKEFRIHQKDLNSNTVLLSINGTIGNVALYQNEKVMLGKSAAYINLLPHINRIYIANFLESRIFKNYYQLELSGSTINNLSLFSIGKTPVVLPTDEEQKEIIRFIESETGKIENAIILQQQQIEKLKEYKSSLIDASVTGKVKVS